MRGTAEVRDQGTRLNPELAPGLGTQLSLVSVTVGTLYLTKFGNILLRSSNIDALLRLRIEWECGQQSQSLHENAYKDRRSQMSATPIRSLQLSNCALTSGVICFLRFLAAVKNDS